MKRHPILRAGNARVFEAICSGVSSAHLIAKAAGIPLGQVTTYLARLRQADLIRLERRVCDGCGRRHRVYVKADCELAKAMA